MKYKKANTKSLVNIREEMELKALKHSLEKDKNLTAQIYRANKSYYLEQYFNEFPNERQRYDHAKKRLRKLSFLMAIGAIAVTTLGGIAIKETVDNNKYEYIQDFGENDDIQVKTKEQEFRERMHYGTALTQTQKLQKDVNELETQEDVNFHRKEIIADIYNREHPDAENPMTSERLGIIKKSLSYLYERKNEKGETIARVTETQKKDGDEYVDEYLKNAYEFYIDNQLVACYHENGDKILSARIGENQDEFFKSTLDFIKQSEALKFAINQDETVIDQVRDKYIASAEKMYSSHVNTQTKEEQR